MAFECIVMDDTNIDYQVMFRALTQRIDLAFRAIVGALWDWEVGSPDFYGPRWPTILGYKSEGQWQTTLANFNAAIHPDDRERIWAEVVNHLSGATGVYNVEMRLMMRDGVYRWFHSRGMCARRPDGKPYRMAGSIVNIHALKEAQLKIEAQQSELLRSNNELSRFAYVVSHDLQEPLRSILGFCDLLDRHLKSEKETDRAKIYNDVDRVKRAASRMQEMLDDVLVYSRAGSLDKFNLSEINTSDIIAGVLLYLDQSIRESGAVITVSDKMPTIKGDLTHLTSIFLNLIANAIKYRNKEAIPHVLISAKRHGDFYQFAIKDDGIGFDMKYVERIFGLFQRLHTASEYPGTGAGLAIVRKIVEQHGGQVWAESEPGNGSTFYFTLPFIEADRKDSCGIGN